MPHSLRSLGIQKSALPVLKTLLRQRGRARRLKAVKKRAAIQTQVELDYLGARTGGGLGAAKPALSVAKTKRKMSKSSLYHEVRRKLDERAFYPAHDPRKETQAYKEVHQRLVKEHSCLICHVSYDVLKNKRTREDLTLNPYAAKQLETHHHVIEWALANAIDVKKFNESLFPHLKARHSERYDKPFTAKQIADWVDHSEDNLWVLCDVHHRAKYFGIHEITDPIWGPQDLFNDKYLEDVRTAIANDDRAKSSKEKKAAPRQK